ncbi:DUF2158 domain-containing protein [Paraburkholderia strydomiana]|uniref:DUF2158 domain-containing protein n=1 Tax=Paraburkholderia strydomiana TaxID=1245417 RepID=UPI0038B94DD9
MPIVDRNQNSAAAQYDVLRRRYKGKTVRLRSGGPLMTVDEIVPTPTGPALLCCWFDPPGSTKLERAPLHETSIELDDGRLPSGVTI